MNDPPNIPRLVTLYVEPEIAELICTLPDEKRRLDQEKKEWAETKALVLFGYRAALILAVGLILWDVFH